MGDFFVITILISAICYLFVMLFYYKTLYKKEQKITHKVKDTLGESEIVLKKYQIQLQRALSNIDLITDELTKTKETLKTARNRNSQNRAENDKLRQDIKEMQAKIDALL